MLKQLKPILCGQHPSAAPGHPERTRLHFCSCYHILWELDQAAVAGWSGRQLWAEMPRGLEGVSNCVLWWHLMQMGWFFIHLRQRLAKSLLQWKSCCSEHLSKSLGGLLCREVRLQSRFSYHVLRLCMICGACISFSSVLSAVRLRSLLSPCYDAD